jgi:hypothetical protein
VLSMSATPESRSAGATLPVVIIRLIIFKFRIVLLVVGVMLFITFIIRAIAVARDFFVGVSKVRVHHEVDKIRMPRALCPSLSLWCSVLPVRVPRTSIQVIALCWMEVIPVLIFEVPARYTWADQIVIFASLPVTTVETCGPLVAVAAILHVEGHPIGDGVTEKKAGAVAVVVVFKPLPVIKNPHGVTSRIEVERCRGKLLTCKREEDESVLIRDLFSDSAKNFVREGEY